MLEKITLNIRKETDNASGERTEAIIRKLWSDDSSTEMNQFVHILHSLSLSKTVPEKENERGFPYSFPLIFGE